jgi:GNAT superfamily N-acetyltransferase
LSPIQILTTVRAVEELPLQGLSEWFDPFLRHFCVESIRCGGAVGAAFEGSAVAGLFLYHPAEGTGSIFTRQRPVAEELFRWVDEAAIYTPWELAPGAERYLVYSVSLKEWRGVDVFEFAPRLARAEEGPGVVRLLERVYGDVDRRWLATQTGTTDRCFVAEVDGALAGVAWASLVNGEGRLHSLAVLPQYRRLGLGTELLRARLLWLRAASARHAISEIAERNAPSRRVAEREGMEPCDEIFRHDKRPSRVSVGPPAGP